jgi:hypothetical protein
VIPAGAVDKSVDVSITRLSSLPPGWSELLVPEVVMYRLEPEGQQFSKPVTFTFPISAPVDEETAVLWGKDGEFEAAAFHVEGDLIVAENTHFSLVSLLHTTLWNASEATEEVLDLGFKSLYLIGSVEMASFCKEIRRGNINQNSCKGGCLGSLFADYPLELNSSTGICEAICVTPPTSCRPGPVSEKGFPTCATYKTYSDENCSCEATDKEYAEIKDGCWAEAGLGIGGCGCP